MVGRSPRRCVGAPIWAALCALSFALGVASAPLAASAADPPSGERVANGFFLDGANDWPAQWKVRSYRGKDATEFSWNPGGPGLGFVTIRSREPDDSLWLQDIEVEPETWYRVSAWLRATDVGDAAAGGSLLVAGGVFAALGNLRGTQPWQPLTLWVRTGADQRSLTVSCRLGGNGSLNTGTVDCTGFSVVATAAPSQGTANVFAPHRVLERFPWAWPVALVMAFAAVVAAERSLQRPRVARLGERTIDRPISLDALRSGRRPIVLCLAVVLFFHGIYAVTQLLEQQAGYPVYRQELGADYRSFHEAAEIAASGGDPYDNERLVTPPLSVAFASPLVGLGFGQGAVVIFWFSIAAVVAAYLLGVRLHLARSPELRPVAIAAGLAMLVLSYPVLFLADRGNIDGLIALLLWIGLWLVCAPRYDVAGGIALGLAGAIKLYPLLLVVPALIRGRWRVVAGIACAMLAATALHPSESWRFFTARLWERAATYTRFENASAMVAVDAAADLLRAFGIDVPLSRLKIVTNGGFLILLGVVALLDWRRRGRCREDREIDAFGFSCWIPLAVMVPSIVWAYEVVNVIPLLPMLAALAARDPGRPAVVRAVACAAIGLGLCQVYSYALAQLLERHLVSSAPAALNAVGLVVLEIALIAAYAATTALPREAVASSSPRRIE